MTKVANLLLVGLVCVSSVFMATSTGDGTSINTIKVVVEVQNAPIRSSVLRIPKPSSLQELDVALEEHLRQQLQQPAVIQDLEIFRSLEGRFTQLHSAEEVTGRTRLNVILEEKEQDEHLALPARLFDTSTGEFHIGSHRIFLGEIGNSGQGTGLTTWDGAAVLAKYLEKHVDVTGSRIVELGAGTGLAGLSAALLGASEVVLTDLAYTLPNLSKNARRTMEEACGVDSKVLIQELDWFNPPEDIGDIDFVLAADVVWVEELIPPLVQTMYMLLKHSKATARILMSHQHRSKVSDGVLYDQLQKYGMSRRLFPSELLDPSFRSDKIDVFEIQLEH